ncbi:MAG: hypothetical protein A3B99_03020 [Candidatus Yanofskybacteria bacterium RIFCSPHIGHO2_02_FULL_44_12b]|uniref:General secretion pathway GspH domain-containing protein n=2 Tax=Candidatus Yanofskyibacteriota TaxID=1752733 RepID=A0A1F8GPD5_9BACT|nr:MAG: hypothetical protein UW79_C0005G0033 [Candidatus Yanofskybacteria bacterium GW2011_GWA2_44_9]OGN05496.1 MAG: hypothetical protein A2659_02795 [Candidatus Yanofskybacteria bacterium RIFCSPHIGHO2_01_FULL_44_24]OGN15047.1 MAG: hypothetical protein A3B99_03020 [Candidatus Yanofskybacteria bacterium RIFCSPHIGHO2_02_FULL_44_12b]OGN26516.1 MAG: hypothetical protein A2925_03165 [Candidatus Yanofskybacteria bacterium RIFCSPLOWO2_01_FULL_44_22]
MLIFFKKPAGFSLVDLLVVITITSFLTITLIRNFTTQLNIERVANVVLSDLRNTQAYAISARKYQGPLDSQPVSRCGYGVHQDQSSSQTYIIYAGPASTANCSSRAWQTSQDTPTFKTVVLDSRLEFETNPRFKDIYYEPPDPQTYIGNTQTQSQPEEVVIRKIGVTKQQCNTGNKNCIKICVYISGRVEITKTGSCP